MKTKLNCLIIALAIFAGINHVAAQGTTAFTYQGRLNTGANAANGSYDMTFAVFDANVGGNQIAGPITNSAVAVSNGLFTVTLDFGAGVFTGTNYWVNMSVSPAGANTFATLVPRQQLTPAPYALSLVSPQANALCPPGSVMAYMGTNAPNGWLLCDGSVVSISQYPALYAVIGTSSGNGNGSSTTFNLPDMRGVFLRGVNGTRSDGLGDQDAAIRQSPVTGANSGNAVGSYQTDMFKSHNHAPVGTAPTGFLTWYEPTGGSSGADSGLQAIQGGGITCGASTETANTGGSETRPRNVYVNYIIKY
jgi:microcystin-dependent protein